MSELKYVIKTLEGQEIPYTEIEGGMVIEIDSVKNAKPIADMIDAFRKNYPAIEIGTDGANPILASRDFYLLNKWVEAQAALENTDYRRLTTLEQGMLGNDILVPFLNDGHKVAHQGGFMLFNTRDLRSWLTKYYGKQNLQKADDCRVVLKRWTDKPLSVMHELQLCRVIPKLRETYPDLPEVMVFCRYSDDVKNRPWSKVLLSYDVDGAIHYVELRRSEVQPVRNDDINAVGQATMRALWDNLL